MEGFSKKAITSYSYPFTDSHDEEDQWRLFYEYWVLRRQPRMTFQKYGQTGSQKFGLKTSLSSAPSPTFVPTVDYNCWQLNQTLAYPSQAYTGSIVRMLELELRFRIVCDISMRTNGSISSPDPITGQQQFDVNNNFDSTYARWSVWVVYDRAGYCKTIGGLPNVGGVLGVLLQQKEDSVLKQDWKETFLILRKWHGHFDCAHQVASVDDTVDLMGLPVGVGPDGSFTCDDLDYGSLFMMALCEFVPGLNECDPEGVMSHSIAFADANCAFRPSQ